MAAAVLLGATVVRKVLVPATMSLLGHLNSWMPGWLDRLLPRTGCGGDEKIDEPLPVEAAG